MKPSTFIAIIGQYNFFILRLLVSYPVTSLWLLKNHVEVHDSLGARRELPKHYYERFREAFITEANEFTASCLDGSPAPISLQSSVRALIVGQALQRSLLSGQKIFFDEKGFKSKI